MQLRRFWVPPLAAALLLTTFAAGATSAGTLVAAGDISNPPGGGRGDVATARVIAQQAPDAVLTLGDTQYERGEYGNFLRAYDRSWGRFKSRTRPSVGNHEYMDPAGPAAGYFRYFGRRAGDPSKGYYSFDIGPWHAVALNSNGGAAGAPSCGHGSAQWSWLKQELASHPQRCTVAFFHHPYRSSAAPYTGKAELKHLWSLLVSGGGRPGPQRPQPRLRAPQAHADHGRRRPRRRPVDGDRRDQRPVADPVLVGPPQLLGPALVYGVYKMVLYPDRWVGAHKGTDGVTRDLRSIGCH